MKRKFILFALLVVGLLTFVGCNSGSGTTNKDWSIKLQDGTTVKDNDIVWLDYKSSFKVDDIFKATDKDGKDVEVTWGSTAASVDTTKIGDVETLKYYQTESTITATPKTGDAKSVSVKFQVKDTMKPTLTITETEATIVYSQSYNLEANVENAIDLGWGRVTDKVEINAGGWSPEAEPGVYTITYSYTDPAGNTATQTLTLTVTEVIPTIMFDVYDEDGNISETFSHSMVVNPVLKSQYTVEDIAFGWENLKHVIVMDYDYIKWYTENAPERLVAQWSNIYVANSEGMLYHMRWLQTAELVLVTNDDGTLGFKSNVVTEWCTGTTTSDNKQYGFTASGRQLANILKVMEEGGYVIDFVNDGTNAEDSARVMGDKIFGTTNYGLGYNVSFLGLTSPKDYLTAPNIFVPFDTTTGSIYTYANFGDEVDALDGIVTFAGSKTEGVIDNSKLVVKYYDITNGEVLDDEHLVEGLDNVAPTEEDQRAAFEAAGGVEGTQKSFEEWANANIVRKFRVDFYYTDEETGATDHACRYVKFSTNYTIEEEPIVEYDAITLNGVVYSNADVETSGATLGVQFNNLDALKPYNGAGIAIAQAPYNNYIHVFDKAVLAQAYNETDWPTSGNNAPQMQGSVVAVYDEDNNLVEVRMAVGSYHGMGVKITKVDGVWTPQQSDFGHYFTAKSDDKVNTELSDGMLTTLLDDVPENGKVIIFSNAGAARTLGLKTYFNSNAQHAGWLTAWDDIAARFDVDLDKVTFTDGFKIIYNKNFEVVNTVTIGDVTVGATIDDLSMLGSDGGYGYGVAGRLPWNANYAHVITYAAANSEAYANLFADPDFTPSANYGIAIICDKDGKIVEMRNYKKAPDSWPGAVYFVDEEGNIALEEGSQSAKWGYDNGVNPGDVLANLNTRIPEGGFAIWGSTYGDETNMYNVLLAATLDTTISDDWGGNAEWDVDFRTLTVAVESKNFTVVPTKRTLVLNDTKLSEEPAEGEIGVQFNNLDALKPYNAAGIAIAQAPYNNFVQVFDKAVLAQAYNETDWPDTGNHAPGLQGTVLVVLDETGAIVEVRMAVGSYHTMGVTIRKVDGVWTAVQSAFGHYFDNTHGDKVDANGTDGIMTTLLDDVPENGKVIIFSNAGSARAIGLKTFFNTDGSHAGWLSTWDDIAARFNVNLDEVVIKIK